MICFYHDNSVQPHFDYIWKQHTALNNKKELSKLENDHKDRWIHKWLIAVCKQIEAIAEKMDFWHILSSALTILTEIWTE